MGTKEISMASIVIPLLVAVAGALVYALSTNPKLVEIGRILFFVGSFWTVYLCTGKLLHF